MTETKQVYAFNLLTGEYEGPKTLDNTDRSPISSAWQIPCNMVELAPPEIPEDYKCLWDGSQWILKEVEKPKEPEILEATQCTCQQKLDTKLKKSGIKNESMYKIHQLF